MTDSLYTRIVPPRQPKRPWLVRERLYSYRTGRWGRWHTHATYSSEDAAQSCALHLTATPERRKECEAYVRHRDSLLPVRMDDTKHAAAALRARAGETAR